jgi:AcrR family transcriptional regulator
MTEPLGTRERLLDATVDIIDQHGEVGVRVRDIAAEASVAVTSVYHHFGDRNGLISAAQAARYQRSMTEGLPAFRAGVDSCASRSEFRALVIRSSIERFGVQDRASERLRRVNALGSALDRPELAHRIATIQDDFCDELASILEVARARGWIRPDVDLRMLSAWYIGQITGRAFIELDGERPEHAAWNAIAAEAMIAVAMGDAPGASPDPD